jgi:GNAT superfamily N-acetyltransferase
MTIDTKINDLIFRFAEEKDIPLLLSLIKELAIYEKMLDQVSATEESLKKSLLGERKHAEAIIPEYEGNPVGYAIFFHNFSTFEGKPGLYLEDIYVKPEYRGKGIGKALLSYLAKIALERGCARFEWVVLDWNEPSIQFYKSLGAKPQDEWIIYRMEDKAMQKLAEEF